MAFNREHYSESSKVADIFANSSSVESLLKKLAAHLKPSPRGDNPLKRFVVPLLTSSAEALSSIQEHGVRRVNKDYKHGSFGIAIPFGKSKQLLRVSHAELEKCPKHYPSFVLQPLASWTVGMLRFEIFPEVEMRELGPHDREMIDMAARACGYLFWDGNEGNIGFLKDGTPVITDPGAVIEWDRRNERRFPPEYGYHDGTFMTEYDAYVNNPDSLHILNNRNTIIALCNLGAKIPDITDNIYDIIDCHRNGGFDNLVTKLSEYQKAIHKYYTEKQKAHLDAYGLKPQTVADVIDDARLEKINAVSSTVGAAVKKHHLDRPTLREAWKGTVGRMMKDDTPIESVNWRDHFNEIVSNGQSPAK